MVPLAGLFSNHESVQRLGMSPRKARATDIDSDGLRRSTHRARRMSQEEVDVLIGEFRAGATVTQLAERFDVHRTTVMAQLRRGNVPRLGEWSPTQVSHVADRYRGGETLDEIAVTLGVDPRTVGRQLRRAGVPIRPSGPRRHS